MLQQPSQETTALLHELNLGQHTLLIMSDDSIDLLACDEQPSTPAVNGLRLSSEESYLLFVSLQEQFQQKNR